MRKLNKSVFYGLYNDEEVLLDAIRACKKEGLEWWDVFTPFPVHGLDAEMGLSESRLHLAGFGYGITGTTIAFSFMTWVFTRDWPVVFGGKPYFAFPSFVPIMFEFTVLMAAVGMVVTFYLICGLGPGVENPYLHPRITDDKFCIAFDVTGKSEAEVAKMKAFFNATHAEFTETKEI
jgi:Protein of unknown function (DUF3341)